MWLSAHHISFLLKRVLHLLQQKLQKDLSQFQRKSAHAPQKELPKRKLMKIHENYWNDY